MGAELADMISGMRPGGTTPAEEEAAVRAVLWRVDAGILDRTEAYTWLAALDLLGTAAEMARKRPGVPGHAEHPAKPSTATLGAGNDTRGIRGATRLHDPAAYDLNTVLLEAGISPDEETP